MIRAPVLSVPPSLMRLRRAVLQTPLKSSVPARLPLYKSRPLLTHPESILLQVLIPLHFNSPRINTYKKPGRGSVLLAPKVYNSSLLPCRLCSLAIVPVTPFRATLTSHLQLAENAAALSPAFATLTCRVKHKSFVCHSYKKHPGWGGALNRESPLQCRLLNCQLSTVNFLLLPSPPHPGATRA